MKPIIRIKTKDAKVFTGILNVLKENGYKYERSLWDAFIFVFTSNKETVVNDLSTCFAYDESWSLENGEFTADVYDYEKEERDLAYLYTGL